MHNPTSVLVTLTAALAAMPAAHAGMYAKNSPVIQLNAASYEKLIAQSNYTSIVEFYAPWCGHCKNLQPAYEKVAKSLEGLAKVAAIDCDDEKNKNFCGMQGVKGFPTLKIVRPGKSGRPVVEDYNGERTAGAISQAVASKINNHVTRVTSTELDGFLEGDKPKAILYSPKTTTSPLLRSIAIDFLDVISIAQIRDKEAAAVEKFNIKNFPSLVLIPGPGQEPIIYEGAMEKKEIVKFLSQAGQPNPDPASTKKRAESPKAKDKSTGEKESKNPKANSKAAESETKAGDESESSTASAETTADTAIPSIIPISTLSTQEDLAKECLQPKSHTCLLLFTPSEETETGDKALGSLSHINTKYVHGKRHLFPFFSVTSDSEAASTVPKVLGLDGEVSMVAINARRGWWRQYEGDFSNQSVENWIDTIRMGEGSKNKLPQGIVEKVAESSSTETAATEASEVSEATEATEATEAAEAEPEVEAETVEEKEEKIIHEEL
ncbi:hypothetical protein QQX98_004157 [Neonectria punicea]|uniref:protein disulfide-isomerase n=1 Tax=Neonectria punicea TaxID=979145 RepID=A0ABR1HAK5_9HYPO